MQRAEEDAHTLTVAAQTAADWPVAPWRAEAGAPLHTEVSEVEPVVLTLTF